MEMSKGPWTQEEDSKLTKYVAIYGEGHWTALSRSAGLKRSGKSCRLRWLNYLKPDVRRGNISLQEQLLIIQLNLQFGNRWSKIAKHLPGRTDNDIKNYWRTKVKKLAKQLKCDVTSQKFKDAMKYVWMPRLVEQIRFTSFTSSQASADQPSTTVDHSSSTAMGNHPTTELSHAPVDSSFKTEDSSISELTNCYDLLGNNWPSDSNSIQDGDVYGLESVAASDSYGLGGREAIGESNSLLSGEDWLELFPEYNYNDIWEDQQIYI